LCAEVRKNAQEGCSRVAGCAAAGHGKQDASPELVLPDGGVLPGKGPEGERKSVRGCVLTVTVGAQREKRKDQEVTEWHAGSA
jgi:hypothetical protein